MIKCTGFRFPPVAKLDIAADSDSEGRGFESLRAGHENTIRFAYEWYFQLYCLTESGIVLRRFLAGRRKIPFSRAGKHLNLSELTKPIESTGFAF